MKNLILVYLLLLAVWALPSFSTPSFMVTDIESHTMKDKEFSYLKKIIDQGMNRALEKAVDALNEKGEYRLSQEITNEWSYRFHKTLFLNDRDIGDHVGISTWINDTYRKIESVLGQEFCVGSHIAAMLTFNSANVVIKPCTFPMDAITGSRIDEYRRHFAGQSIISDSKYNGVMPEASYFVMEIACLAGTSGVGSFACSMASGIVERMMAVFVAPSLSDFVYNKSCGGD